MTVRIEHDLLGDREIPAEVYWGIHTQNAVQKVLQQGLRTSDIYEEGTKLVSCSEMGDAVLAAL